MTLISGAQYFFGLRKLFEEEMEAVSARPQERVADAAGERGRAEPGSDGGRADLSEALRRALRVLVLVALAALVFAGCGSDDEGGGSSGDDDRAAG